MRFLAICLMFVSFASEAKFKVTILNKEKPVVVAEKILTTKLEVEKTTPEIINKLVSRNTPVSEILPTVEDATQQASVPKLESEANSEIPLQGETILEMPVKNELLVPKLSFEVREGMTLGLAVKVLSEKAGMTYKLNLSNDWLENIIFSSDHQLGTDVESAMQNFVTILNGNQALIDRNIKFKYTISNNILELENA